MQYLLNTPAESDWAIAAARAAYNASLPQTVTQMQQQPGPNEGDPPVQVPVQVPNPDLLASDGDYISFVIGKAVTSWAQTHQAVAPPPVVDPVVVNGVPQEVTMRQAQQQMLYTPTVANNGSTLLDAVNTALAALPDDIPGRAAKISWAKSSTVQRTNPLITQMVPVVQQALGLADATATNAAIDQLFIAAAKLAA